MGSIRNWLKEMGHPQLERSGMRALLLFWMPLVVAAYWLLALVVREFILEPDMVSPVWPPAAIGVAACLAWGGRMVPAIWLGAMLGIVSIGTAPVVAGMIAFGAALESFVAARLILYVYKTRFDFLYQNGIFRFIAIALATSALGASVSTLGYLTLENTLHWQWTRVWFTWWLGNAAGIVVLVPALLTWNVLAGLRRSPAARLEAVAFAVLLPTITLFVFSGTMASWPISYLPIPLLLWAAFRFNFATVAWASAFVCGVAAWKTALGEGPFALDGTARSLLILMLYINVVGSMALAMANLVHQRRDTQRRLKLERDNLEARVRERTDALEADIEQRKQVERRLAMRERQLEEAQQLAQVGSWHWYPDKGGIVWSDEMYRIYGVDKAAFEVTLENCARLIHPDDLPMLMDHIEASRQSGMPFHVEHRIVLPDGRCRVVAARGEAAKSTPGQRPRMHGTVQDITDAKAAEASLREAEARYRAVMELSPNAIMAQQDGVYVMANPAAVRLLHARGEEDIIGRRVFDFLPDDLHDAARERIAHLQRGEPAEPVEQRILCLDGTLIDIEVNSAPFTFQGKPASVMIVRDITERKRTAEQLAYLAHFDSLTGLPNRAFFRQRLEHALEVARRPGRSLELLFLDIDRFKHINDTLGHAVGDLVLKETAQRLQSILRDSDTVARLGGDEFVVLVENVDEPHRGGIIAEKILGAFSAPFLRDREPMTVSTSIGISSYPTDGNDAEILLQKADMAMYSAKQVGRSCYRYFSADMNRHVAERMALEYALSHAVEHGEMSLHYQPKFDVMTGRITGMEALLRWEHPTLGTVPPQRFIPVAEESGLIRPIGYWAIRTACTQNRTWQEHTAIQLKVAVNLTARQLADERLVEMVSKILRETGLSAACLELEVTEATVMANPELAVSVFTALNTLGVTIAIEDFGSGYSSLSWLRRFPIRAVKLDQSFLQAVSFSREDAAIAKAIIDLGHSLECSVIAEGAETQQQYDFLRENECDSVQGYYFSKPVTAEGFAALIKLQSGSMLH